MDINKLREEEGCGEGRNRRGKSSATMGRSQKTMSKLISINSIRSI